MANENDAFNPKDMPRYQVVLSWIIRAVALSACLSAIAFPIYHEISNPLPTLFKSQNGLDRTFSTADAFLQTVLFLSTLSFGLVAVAGFAIRNGIGKFVLTRDVNILLLSFLTYFLSRTIIYAFDAFRTVTIQLDTGNIYLTVLSPILEKQGTAVLYSAVFAVAILGFNSITESRSTPS